LRDFLEVGDNFGLLFADTAKTTLFRRQTLDVPAEIVVGAGSRSFFAVNRKGDRVQAVSLHLDDVLRVLEFDLQGIDPAHLAKEHPGDVSEAQGD
jgi:hypothetical protein